jgi:hypothetical protein
MPVSVSLTDVEEPGDNPLWTMHHKLCLSSPRPEEFLHQRSPTPGAHIGLVALSTRSPRSVRHHSLGAPFD